MEQMMWPGIPMLFVAGWTGNFTSLSSILINKFVLNPTFGQGSWNMHGRYSGEDAGLHSFINDLRALDPNSKDFVKERNRLVRHHTIKKGGHIEGGFGSFGSFFMSLDTLYDQIVGYLFACYYSLSNDDQPLGSSLDKMHIRLFSGVNMLFTPEYGFYRTFYSSLHDPKKHLDGGKDDREFILEQINAYLLSNPINSKEPAPLDVEGWENWAFVRNLAILSFLASENTMTPLENNPELEKVRQTALWYLQGTEKLSKEKQLKVALSRLSREASIRFQGRTAYGVF
jgi:hypothetical protein